MSRPTLVNLETALCVAEIGTFSGAARKLEATQPGIAMRVHELEAALGYRLFTRRGHTMQPTVKGRNFLDKLGPMMQNLQELLSESGDEHAISNIRIGSGQIPMSAWLGRVIGRLQIENAKLRFHIRIGTAGALIPLLEQDKLDLVVISGRIEYPGLRSERLGRRSAGKWVMAPDRWKRFAPYPAQSDAPSLSELINCGPLWTPSTTSRFYTDISDVLRHHGAHLHNINTCDDMRMMADLIGMSGGLGYLPAVLIGDILAQQKLVLVPGLPSTGESEYYFVWRQLHLLPIVRTLMKLGQAESEVGEAP